MIVIMQITRMQVGLMKKSETLQLMSSYMGSDYVRKCFDVKKRAFLSNYMRDFGRFYAKFLFINHPRNNRCEIRAFVLKIMRVFLI